MIDESLDSEILTPGTCLVGRYEVKKHLGSGANGCVYHVIDTSFGKEVALKILAQHKLFDDKAVAQFKNEFEIMRSLDHPNVVKTYELIHLENNGLGIAIELIKGRSLSKIIEQSYDSLSLGSLSLKEKLNLLTQICQGLAYAHNHKLVHRDLKPENILTTSSGNVKIVDFGIAHREIDKEEAAKLGSVSGTPFYMSPEQHHGDYVDRRTDIYSLGVLAYKLFTGELPFNDTSTFKLFVSHIAAPVPKAREKDPSLPKWIDTMIHICMEKEPNHRYQSVEDIIELLESKRR